MKEITAEILACSEGFSTHEQSTVKLNGGQWDKNVERLVRENEKLSGNEPDAHQSQKAATNRLKNLIIESALKAEKGDESNEK